MEIKPFKIKVTPEQSKIVQEVLFTNKIRWSGSVCSVIHTDKRYLIIDDFIVWCEQSLYYSETGIPELTFEQFQELYCQIPKPAGKVENPFYAEKSTPQQESYNTEDRKLQYLDKEEFRDCLRQKALKLTSQQEIDDRLREYGYNIPQQELVSVSDDRLDKIIERLDKIIELLERKDISCSGDDKIEFINLNNQI